VLETGIGDSFMMFLLHRFTGTPSNRFTVETVNFRMDLFTWGPTVSNKPPLLSGNFDQISSLKMTGSKKLAFILLSGVIVGD